MNTGLAFACCRQDIVPLIEAVKRNLSHGISRTDGKDHIPQ